MAKKRGKKSMRSPAIVVKPPTTADMESSKEEITVTVPAAIIVPAKVCRLCKTKDGPFLNIFGGEKNTAKKIEDLMPFVVAENDELPHKICFRCSAKIEELHEFIQKCIKTQENLYGAMGKKYPLNTKVKMAKLLWEEKLNKSNITNDDICDAAVKKAMERIQTNTFCLLSNDIKKDATKLKEKPGTTEFSPKQVTDNKKKSETKKNQTQNIVNKSSDKDSNELKSDIKLSYRSSRSNIGEPLLDGTEIPPKIKKTKGVQAKTTKDTSTPLLGIENPTGGLNADSKTLQQPVEITENKSMVEQTIEEKEKPKPFNVMDHVCMIKVNGVGILFQCKLCNRNFLKKEVVLTHFCAKNGASKEDFSKKAAMPEVPKAPTVKYINTRVDDFGNAQKNIQNNSSSNNKTDESSHVSAISEEEKQNSSENKSKPKIGPASKVKRVINECALQDSSPPTQKKDSSVVEPPIIPSLNCRYKLLPGPNNTYILVEATPADAKATVKRKIVDEDAAQACSKQLKQSELAKVKRETSPEVIDLGEESHEESSQEESILSTSHPYPVGLFKTVNPQSKDAKRPAAGVVPFTATAQKKQSYVVVQTNNPSKLLISAKPQPNLPAPEVQKKRHKKVKATVKEKPTSEQPFSVTLEDATPVKDSSFFTFINVDPLLQPSYVLPTDNTIVQESQISTSSKIPQKLVISGNNGKEQYSCNMCNEKFTREQKLLAHIHSHYNKLDEEDQQQTEKNARKRGKRSLI